MRKTLIIVTVLVFILSFASCSNTQNSTEALELTATQTPIPTATAEPEYLTDGGDIHIIKDGFRLKDFHVEGDLYIDDSVGDGEFYLENVTVDGTVYVNGGGENSGYFINVSGKDLIIQSKTNPKVVLDMNTSIEGIQIASDCKVHSEGDKIKSVTINSSDTENAVSALLKGEFPEVSIESTADVTIDGNVSLMTVLKKARLTNINMIESSKMYFYSCNGESVSVHGGTIIEAWINAEYCSLPDDVDKIGSETGVADVKIGDVQYTLPKRAAADENADNSGQDNNNSEKSDAKEDNATDENPEGFALSGYPTAFASGMNVTVTISSYTSGTAYILVESDDVGGRDTTSENVKNGISAGSGSSDYTVIFESFKIASPLAEYSHTINLESYLDMGGNGDGPPGGKMSFSGYVIVVIEDSQGNLSGVYKIKV